MDNSRKLAEELLKADGIDPNGATESERIAFVKMLDQQSKSKPSKPNFRPDIWSRIMKSKITKSAAAAIIIVAGLIFFNTANSSLYAQVVKAMEKTRTIHAIGYSLQEGKMVKATEIWYERNVGYKMVWQHKGSEKLMIDDGQTLWNYQQGHDFAVKSKSISTERLPKEFTETSRYLDKCTKDPDKIDMIDGHPCQVYIGSYPDKPNSTRLIFWIDENLRPRRFEEKVLENDTWKVIEHVDIEYDVDMDISTFKPDFGSHVEIIHEGKILDENFSLEKAIFTKEEMGLIFAVHEVQRCQNDLIFTVTSLRPNQNLNEKFASRGITAWNYGDYQFGSSYERLGLNTHRSYSPIEMAWFYRNGLVIRWTVFIPHGFEPGQVDKIKLELYYLYARGDWAAKRKADGLEDRIRISPIATLPLPDESVNLESQLNKTYNHIKLLEPMVAEKHLQLKPIPFTDEEMEEYIKELPNSGETIKYRTGDRSDKARMLHGKTLKASQISFDSWLEDRLACIKKSQNQ